jgi:hypothetical protein
MNIKLYIRRLTIKALWLAWIPVSAAHAGIAVIGHPDDRLPSLSQKDVRELFLGKSQQAANGKHLKIVDQNEDNEIRDEFYKKIADKNRRQMQAYWINRIFTGRGTPPSPVGNDTDVKSIVSASPGYLGYIDTAQVDDSVQVLLIIP